ncbi:hypothetical protein IMCC3317_10290 [Kordia antarctica]|uniref:Lipoyl-binding domain-containing protein n=1 Tax=Kordia antarctica TaxID=1218801 RepID=A0A7L4ZGB4_9FLAO|nr:biotin/lipoyl-containing protein [Kordia antarctica]QHI35682.1 hypothetical protein IMCC3317_10290 [Kordia antarctica]
MNKIIKTIFSRLFPSQEKRDRLKNDLKVNSNFRTSEELEQNNSKPQLEHDSKLKTGHVETLTTPDLGNQKGLVLTKWYYKTGDIVKHGDILCRIENENLEMEYESFCEGKLIWCCENNKKLTVGMEICKIEGI